LAYSGHYTQISGHTSIADQAEARESLPVRDRRSNHWATHVCEQSAQNHHMKVEWRGVERTTWVQCSDHHITTPQINTTTKALMTHKTEH